MREATEDEKHCWAEMRETRRCLDFTPSTDDIANGYFVELTVTQAKRHLSFLRKLREEGVLFGLGAGSNALVTVTTRELRDAIESHCDMVFHDVAASETIRFAGSCQGCG